MVCATVPETLATARLPLSSCVHGMMIVGCIMFQQHARVYQGRICLDNFTCCHREREREREREGEEGRGRERGREGGREGERDREREEGEREREREGGRERKREGEGGREGEREKERGGGREGGRERDWMVVGCITPQQHARVPQGRISSDNFTCCHTEIEVADQTFYLTQSQYTDTGPTSPSADRITPGAWEGSQWSANF